MTANSTRSDVYQIITDRIIEILDQGVTPWRKPWSNGIHVSPRNFVSGKEYQGINTLLLSCSHYSSPYWLTYKQAQDKGGYVRKGEKGMPVVFWKMYEKEDKTAEDGKKVTPILRYYTVFNAEQCEGIGFPEVEQPETFNNNPIEEAEAVQLAMPNRPHVEFGGDMAFYRRSTDTVRIPERSRFEKVEEFYSTLFHELAHSTGHEDRLNRAGIVESHFFGDATYSKEELIAEMTSAFLCAHCHIETTTIENSAAYIQGWIKALKGDKRLAVTAASAAQKAANFILNIHHD